MVSELVSESVTEGVGSGESAPHFAYDSFYEVLPFYLSIGMTWDEYWNGDPYIAKAYRQAFVEKRKRQRDYDNFHAWLQGMYIYEAVADVAPVLHAFAKKGTKIRPYSKQPYELQYEDNGNKAEKRDKAFKAREKKKEKREMLNLMAKIQNQVSAINKAKKGGKQQ